MRSVVARGKSRAPAEGSTVIPFAVPFENSSIACMPAETPPTWRSTVWVAPEAFR